MQILTKVKIYLQIHLQLPMMTGWNTSAVRIVRGSFPAANKNYSFNKFYTNSKKIKQIDIKISKLIFKQTAFLLKIRWESIHLEI